MRNLIAAEWLKVRKRKLPWILAVSLVAIIVLLYGTLLLAASTATADQSFARELNNNLRVVNTVRFGDGIVYRVVALLSLILTATIVANEYHWRTVVTRVTWTGERVRPFLATMMVVGALSAAGLVLGHAVVALAAIGGEAARGTFEGSDLGLWLVTDSGLAALRSVPGVAVFVAGAATAALLTRSTAVGVCVPLAVLFLEPLGAAILTVSDGTEWLSRLLLSQNVDALLAANGAVRGSTEDLPEGLPSAWQGALSLVLYAAVALAVGVRVLARREMPE